jgi:cation:H+ antiporter
MNGVTLILFVLGLALLVAGAEALIRGSSRLAVAIGISPLVVGLTVVAYGTSAPEVAVGVQSALGGKADLAIGNVVGSNIFNVLFILGLAAMITPLVVAQQLVRLDVPIMIGLSVLAWLMGLDGRISRLDGSLLCAGAIVYTVFAVWQSRRESRQIQEEYRQEYGDRAKRTLAQALLNVLLIIGGLGLLVLGARWLVNGAVDLARTFGISELIIGLTIIAAGTSLPEVAASVIAAVRGERDIAVGNVVGSNIFNLLLVLGLSALVSPVGISVSPAALNFDMPVMIAVAIACLVVFFNGHRIARWEGALFFGYWIAYTLYLILDATRHEALHSFSQVMVMFVIPLTVLTLIVVTVRTVRARTVREGLS